jgi:murein DD-endopeptidase MepM/ murein hydrolase activator NlpD
MATYTVKKGDTLSAIGKQFGVSYQDIAKANGISNPNKIQVGQVLNIGGNTAPTAPTTTAPKATAPTTPTTPKGSEIADKNRQDILAANPGAFTYDPYQSNWLTQLSDIYNKISNREEFSYDLNGDALYQQYKDQYKTQGNLASMDVMGQAAAMNGGYGSSYGQTVGHQAYQGYLQQLNDRVPELYQLALNQYNQEGQELYNQYGLLADMDNRDYTRYMDDVNMKYGLHGDKVTQWQNELNRADNEYWNLYESEYRNERDAIADAETKKKYAYDTAMGMLSMGVTPSAEMLTDAGISSTDAQFIVSKVKENEAKAASGSGSGGSGSGGNGGNGGSGGKGGAFTDVLWNPTGTVNKDGNPIFINSDGKTQAYGKGVNPYTGTTHKDAKKGTFSNGYQPNNIGGTKLKNSGMSTSITGKNQTIWEANGKYWLWRGDLNKYVEVDISDLD